MLHTFLGFPLHDVAAAIELYGITIEEAKVYKELREIARQGYYPYTFQSMGVLGVHHSAHWVNCYLKAVELAVRDGIL